MATGDQADFVRRMRAVLPARWFPLTAPGATSATPVLDGVLNGIARAWAWLYGLCAYMNEQARIATATDVWLDITSMDFLSTTLPRRPGEPDPVYSGRIRAAIIAPKNTRASVLQAVTLLTGHTPIIFEPADVRDTGGVGWLGMTVGTGLCVGGGGVTGAGGAGSLALPFQCFVTAYYAGGGGIAGVQGAYYQEGGESYTTAAYGGVGSLSNMGAGAGAIEVGALSMSRGQITDTDIEAAIVNTMPAGTIAWVTITNAPAA